MATQLQFGDVLQVRLDYRDSQGTSAFNVLHYILETVTLPGGGNVIFNGVDMEDVGSSFAAELFANLFDGWKDFASEDVSMTGVSVQNIDPAPKSRQYNWTANPPGAGNVVGDSLPLQDTPTLIKRTAFGQRWGIGRVFVVGLPESSQDQGRLNQAAVNAINTWGTALLADQAITVAGLVYILRPVLYTTRPNPQFKTLEIQEVQLSDNIIKTQRRRRPGKGI